MHLVADLETSIEPVEYLARSPSRLTVLHALDEEPRDREELMALTDVSRVTLSRFLGNFEERGWIERTDGEYRTTAAGSFVVAEMTRLLANLESLESLDGVIEWLPVDRFDFDLGRLRDAEVTTASWRDHTAQMRRVVDAIRGADRIRATASGTSRDVVDALWEATVRGNTSLAAVFDGTAVSVIRDDPELLAAVREMAEHGARFARYEGPEAPLVMSMTCDDTVLLCGHDMDGPPPGTLETTDERVRAWAATYFETVRSGASGLNLERLVGRQ